MSRMRSWLIALSAASCCLTTPHLRAQDYSYDRVSIEVSADCSSYRWPIRTIFGGVERTRWHDEAIKAICNKLGAAGKALTLEVRADGTVLTVNGQPLTPAQALADIYGNSSQVTSPWTIDLDGLGRVTTSPQNSLSVAPNLKNELARASREVEMLAKDLPIREADHPISVTIMPDGSISWGGMADPSTGRARRDSLARCVSSLWDLPFERSLICGARAALVGLVP